jgi:hypothetical protein
MDRTDENRLAPGQNYRRGVAGPPYAFPPMFRLQQRCADAGCHGGDRHF